MKRTISERLREFVNSTKLKDNEFGRKFNASKQEISSWTHGRKISLSKMHDMLEAFPKLNGHWLLTGNGRMLNNENEIEDPEAVYLTPECQKIVTQLKNEMNKQHDEINRLNSIIIELQKEMIEWMKEKKN